MSRTIRLRVSRRLSGAVGVQPKATSDRFDRNRTSIGEGCALKASSVYMRSTELVVVTTREAVLFIGASEPSIDHNTEYVGRWSDLIQALSNPISGDTLRRYTQDFLKQEIDFIDKLIDRKFILESSTGDSLAEIRDRVFSENNGFHCVPAEPSCENLIVACTGSVVAGLMAPTLLSLSYSRFQKRLDVVLTEAAQKFVTRDLIESYGIRTWADPFERKDDVYVPHVHLARSADCVLVMPATANSLHRIAVGACTDLLSMLIAATHAPVVLAPAMNDAMWNNDAVQRNVQALRRDGMYVLEPTIIFGAADFANQGQPMYGGHGTLWSGPYSLMRSLSHIVKHAAMRGRRKT